MWLNYGKHFSPGQCVSGREISVTPSVRVIE